MYDERPHYDAQAMIDQHVELSVPRRRARRAASVCRWRPDVLSRWFGLEGDARTVAAWRAGRAGGPSGPNDWPDGINENRLAARRGLHSLRPTLTDAAYHEDRRTGLTAAWGAR